MKPVMIEVVLDCCDKGHTFREKIIFET